MLVDVARDEDIANWLHLASEVEFLFGPMVNEPDFHRALRKHINQGTAHCVREDDGSPGTPLMGGLLFTPKPLQYAISWLAVAQRWRRYGVGRLLVEHVFRLVQSPAEMTLITFGSDIEAGQPARKFYESLGFHPAESAPPGAEGGSRQVYRRIFRPI